MKDFVSGRFANLTRGCKEKHNIGNPHCAKSKQQAREADRYFQEKDIILLGQIHDPTKSIYSAHFQEPGIDFEYAVSFPLCCLQ